MATVYRAKDLRLGRDVAVKVIHPHLRDKAEAVRRFSIEARAVAKLHHPNIVEVFDVSSPEEAEQYLVVELLRGVTLRQLLERHGTLPPEVAASLGVELLSAVAHAHEQGVIHRDVKPENVILEHRPRPANDENKAAPPQAEGAGGRIAIKLMDFGIAKLLDAQGVTSTGQVLGSPAHMAPEQIEGREVDGRADVFGLGVLLYECMVGHLPFQGTNPAQVLRRVLDGEYPSAERERPVVGQAWSRILDQALASDLEARFAGAVQMRDALTRELTRMGVASPRGEVEAWLDDPPGFVAASEARMPKCLCTRAEEASRRGDAVGAAGDYNRALAYAPHDASLLKIVATMNRRTARHVLVRRSVPYAAGAVAVTVAVVAFAALRHNHVVKLEPAIATEVRSVVPPVAAVVSAVFPAEPLTPARVVARPEVGGSAQPRASAHGASRDIRFGQVEPTQGVRLSIDGAQAMPLDPSRPLTLDDKPHSLTFTCEQNLCNTVVRNVDPTDKNPAPLSVHLTIKPGKLIIRGSPVAHYFLSDDPARGLSPGDDGNAVPMAQTAQRTVVVNEMETHEKRTVLVTAGRTAEVRFASGAAP
jgi:serine/threonine-protein kinase